MTRKTLAYLASSMLAAGLAGGCCGGHDPILYSIPQSSGGHDPIFYNLGCCCGGDSSHNSSSTVVTSSSTTVTVHD